MRRLIVVLIACSLAWSAAQNVLESNAARERAGYFGPVKRVTTEEELEDTPRRVRQDLHFGEAGTPTRRTTYSYTFVDGTLRSSTETQFGAAGEQLIQETLDPEGNVLSQTIFRYTNAGDMAERVVYDASGAITERAVLTYDASRNLIREERYRGPNLYRRTDFRYDARGLPQKRETFDGDGVLLEARSYRDDGLFFETTEYDEAGAVDRRSSARLDERGNFLELTTYDLDGQIEDRTIFTYDDRGLLLEESFSHTVWGEPSTITTRYEYTFDAYGNWTVRRMVEQDDVGVSTVLETLYRSIEYY
jgi:hypothetical protein